MQESRVAWQRLPFNLEFVQEMRPAKEVAFDSVCRALAGRGGPGKQLWKGRRSGRRPPGRGDQRGTRGAEMSWQRAPLGR